MTKKEWSSLTIGSKVRTETLVFSHELNGVGQRKLVSKQITGKVRRFNSNCSQVLVEWIEEPMDRWYGRLGLELVQPQQI